MPDVTRSEIRKLRDAYSRDPSSRAFLQLAEAHRRAGELSQAHQVLRKGLSHHPDYTGAHVVLAHVLSEQGRRREAEAAWSRVVELDPENTLALRALGEIARADGRREQALAHYQRLLTLENDDAEVQHMITELSAPAETPAPAEAAADEPPAAEAPRPRANGRNGGTPAPAPEPETAPVNRVQLLVNQPAAVRAGGTTPLVEVLVRLLEHRGSVFRSQSSLTRLLAMAIGRELELQEAHLDALALAALLSDLGELALGAGDAGEEAGPRNVAVTLQLLQGIALPAGVQEAIAHQHEHWDGGGTPKGLAEDDIPFSARILAVARATAELLADGPDRTPLSIPAAIDEMQRRAGSVFDPVVVSMLRRVFSRREQHGIGYQWGGHVFIAHPEELRGLGLATQLHSSGYATQTARDSGQVRDRLRATPVQAVVLGARLADGDVAGLIQEIRSTPQLLTVPVVVIDAGSPEQRIGLLSAGADVCFAPDVSFQEFRATLDALLRRSELVSGAAPLAGAGGRAFA